MYEALGSRATHEGIGVNPCKSCDTPYSKRVDERGRELVNIDPVSGLCIQCLCASSKAQVKPMGSLHVDVRKRQAKDE
jgi:hypothetical protein